MPKIVSMVVLGVSCAIRPIKLYFGSLSISIGILWKAKKSSFILDTGDSGSVKIRKHFNNSSISSQLGTSIAANYDYDFVASCNCDSRIGPLDTTNGSPIK